MAMYSGYVQFHARVEELELPLMTINPAEPKIASIEVAAPAGSPLEITVRFTSIPSEQEARDCARSAAADMIDRIAFDLNISVGDAWYDCEAFTPIPGSAAAGGPMMLGQSIGMSVTGAYWKKPDNTELYQLKQTLEAQRVTLVGGHLMGTYRSALKNKNPVDRFLCLYSIILLKHGDNQGAVDNFIRTKEPGVIQTQSPKFPNVRETVYTRLRNEYSHIRRNTSFDQTRNEMEQNLPGLKALAYQACLIP